MVACGGARLRNVTRTGRPGRLQQLRSWPTAVPAVMADDEAQYRTRQRSASCAFPSTRCGAPDPAGGRKLRPVGRPLPPAFIHALGWSSGPRRGPTRRSGQLDGVDSGSDLRRGARSGGGRHDAAVPGRRVPDRLGTSTNMNANEVIATLAARASASPSTRTTTSTVGRAATTPSRPRCTWRRRAARQRTSCRPWRPRGGSRAASAARPWLKTGAHPPDGRGAASPSRRNSAPGAARSSAAAERLDSVMPRLAAHSRRAGRPWAPA
jgi:hypothetical protein